MQAPLLLAPVPHKDQRFLGERCCGTLNPGSIQNTAPFTSPQLIESC